MDSVFGTYSRMGLLYVAGSGIDEKMSNKKTATTKTNDTTTNDTITNDNNATTSNNTTTSMTNDNNLSETYYIPPTPPNPRPSQRTSNSNRQRRNDSTYDPREDDDYNVNEGRPLDNFSEEYSEWCEENDSNEYENPGQQQERLNQN
ncbi:12042_t:CDS:2 [Cetraspora pellucida]|uniref:12042_t:CDS:1 n=1 Tax=Cetraspora pellucida TaxID=1433469 RepID=A0ACA9KPZ6_9GLOM|nr:12042_t:CDS:2 [Cetraspora pellucida]